MCIFKQPKAVTQAAETVKQTVPQPEDTAEPTAIGKGRKQEDEQLFGGTPDLRVDRNTPPAVSGAGAGLNLM